MNNLQQFLDEEQKDVTDNGHKVFVSEITTMEWLKDHDTRLINFVLDEIKREVEEKRVDCDNNWDWNGVEALEYISNKIDQLKLK